MPIALILAINNFRISLQMVISTEQQLLCGKPKEEKLLLIFFLLQLNTSELGALAPYRKYNYIHGSVFLAL